MRSSACGYRPGPEGEWNASDQPPILMVVAKTICSQLDHHRVTAEAKIGDASGSRPIGHCSRRGGSSTRISG